MKSLVFIILALLLSGCLPQSPVRQAGVSSGATDDSSGGSQVSTSDVELAWYTNLSSSLVLNLFRDSAQNSYIRGRRIENFLLKQNAPTATYCLEFDMGSGVPVTDRRYLRVRAVPVSVNNLAQGNKTIYLRVDFGNTTASTSACALDKVQYIDDTNTQYVTYTSQASAISFTLNQVCQSCVNQIVTSNFKLFTVDTANARLNQVKPSDLNLSIISLALQPGNQPTLGGTCTNSSCSALGYNCCLENQCVRDGAVRSSTNVTSSEFLSAEQEKLSNPLAFLKYPQFYYICGTAQTQPGDTGSGDQNAANAAALARLEEMQKDYACIQHLKANSTSTPFHLSPYNAAASYDQTICNTLSTAQKYHWENVLIRLYNNCGCDVANTTLTQKLTNCPKYDYKVVSYDALSKPIQFACTALDESGVTSPFQKLDVPVSSKAVPHRFFNTTGVEIDPGKVTTTNTNQEGIDFSYADPEKVQPNNGSFNMNSILGNFNIELSEAIPAKVVDVELDNVYLIVTRSGYYTPCPTCARDSWFNAFSATPATSNGKGLEAIGHSTSRDAWDNNTTMGNYEDTIFGRACWVPPTMLPFSQPLTSASTLAQRQTRLKTQAAMWINGYQRDWYGFNKGALIGSFDGVSWFAVGRGRIVRSTTKKLFLAINGAYGDLAENNTHVVSVQAYDGQSSGAQLDFHPEYTQNHPNQNEAATCQAYHRCNVDSDCVTKLGWEYVCADVTQLRTYWPSFDPEGAVERQMTASDEARTIEGILAQGVLPNGSTKRCVYRGAGSVCRTDAGSISATEIEKRKLLTCAPNFFCADLDSSNTNIPTTSTYLNVFNRELSRFAAPLDELPVSNNHIYGRDANMLGRPLYYVHNKFTTPSNTLTQIGDGQIRSTINTNVTAMDAPANGKVGLCRPGKRLPTVSDVSTLWNPFAQHEGLDEFSRTDFINQISSCPSNYFSVNKVTTCPVFGDDGNYLHQSSSFSSMSGSTWASRAREQNSCGLSNLRNGTTITGTADQLQAFSPFKTIEGRPLNVALSASPGLVRDACMRKAGSVCHTDLDCAPNKMHAEQLQYSSVLDFGNQANMEYYEQYLVCGQEKPKPYLTDFGFDDYDITKNRCCREVGKDITTYSAQEPSSVTADSSLTATLDPLITGANAAANPNRYERFSHLRNIGSTNLPVLTAHDDRSATTGAITNRTFNGALGTGVGNVLTQNQWKTLNAANSKTCCGGGWIRKFNDGTVDWKIRNRFRVNVSDFRCLNYNTPLVTTTNPGIWGLTQGALDLELNKYCFDVSGTNGNCAQITIAEGNVNSTDIECAANRENTSTYAFPMSNLVSTLPGAVPYPSNPFAFFPPVSADANPAIHMDFSSTSTRKNIKIYIPTYMGNWNPTALGSFAVVMQRLYEGNMFPGTAGGGATGGMLCTNTNFSTSGPSDAGSCAGNCCYGYNSLTRILTVGMNQTISGAPWFDSANVASTGSYGVRILFTPPGTGSAPIAKPACKDIYYLTQLGRMELAGIPQITFEKLVCNNNAEKLVPGIFNVPNSETNRTQFNTPSFAFNDSSTWRTNYHGLSNGAIFSSHDFKCCTPLNKDTNDTATCCSGYGIDKEEDGTTNGRKTYTCKLPPGANVSVYLNRFVSNEGMSADIGVAPLVEADFDARTGEPLLTPTINSKVSAIGRAVCESGSIRRGGAFGAFAPEPSSPNSAGQTVYGIVDSSGDNGSLSSGGGTAEVGFFAFMQGFRWNHHIYCE